MSICSGVRPFVRVCAGIVLAAVLGSCTAAGPGGSGVDAGRAGDDIKEEGVQVIVIDTSKGTIKFALFEQYAPRHVARFVELADSGFYENLVFHRVEPGTLIQGGDPDGTGRGGSGVKLKAEFNERSHTVGAVGMARARDHDSADCQFYICIRPLQMLDGQYTVFGQVFEGMEVVRAIEKGDRMTRVSVERVPAESLPEEARQ